MSMEEEVYTVSLLRDTKTGVAVMESWKNERGLLHRIGGPAWITRHRDGTVGGMRWYRDGVVVNKPHTKGLNKALRTKYVKRLRSLAAG
jgi:hypothetical protein